MNRGWQHNGVLIGPLVGPWSEVRIRVGPELDGDKGRPGRMDGAGA